MSCCCSTPTTPKPPRAKSWRWRRGSKRPASRSAAFASIPATSSRCRKSVRAILDAGGLQDTTIFASGGLDEDSLLGFARAGAPIDGIGIGTSMTTSQDVPAIDCVYKLQEYAGVPRRKRSENKATWPGRKQVWRRYDANGRMSGDLLSRDDHATAGEPLIRQVMKDGRRIAPSPSLDEIRLTAKRELERLPKICGGSRPARSIRSKSPTTWSSSPRKSTAACKSGSAEQITVPAVWFHAIHQNLEQVINAHIPQRSAPVCAMHNIS